jgi:hypothetical protein
MPMPKQILRRAAAPARLLWSVTGKPIHQRLFGRYFQATISRLNSTLGELSDVRAELEAARREITACRDTQAELDRKLSAVMGAYWDAAAVTRRLATIEDRLYLGQQPPSLGSAEPTEIGPENAAPAEAAPCARA